MLEAAQKLIDLDRRYSELSTVNSQFVNAAGYQAAREVPLGECAWHSEIHQLMQVIARRELVPPLPHWRHRQWLEEDEKAKRKLLARREGAEAVA
jgi:hypothetical protein